MMMAGVPPTPASDISRSEILPMGYTQMESPPMTPASAYKNMTGIYLGQESGPSPGRQKAYVPPLARGRGMPSGRIRTPIEERRYKMVELLRIREDNKGFKGQPLKAKSKPPTPPGPLGPPSPPTLRTQTAPSSDMFSSPVEFQKLVQRNPRRFTRANNTGVTHMEYLNCMNHKRKNEIPLLEDNIFSVPFTETVEKEVDRIAREQGESLVGLGDCYNKVCKGNKESLHHLLPHRRPQTQSKPSGAQYTGFTVKSYRSPNQAEILADFSQGQPRQRSVIGSRLLVPLPYFFRPYANYYESQATAQGRPPGPGYFDERIDGVSVGPGKVLGAPGTGGLSRNLNRGMHLFPSTPTGSLIQVNQSAQQTSQAQETKDYSSPPNTPRGEAAEQPSDQTPLSQQTGAEDSPEMNRDTKPGPTQPKDTVTVTVQGSDNKENTSPADTMETGTEKKSRPQKKIERLPSGRDIKIGVETEDGQQSSVVIDVAEGEDAADTEPTRKQSITERVSKLKSSESVVQSLMQEAHAREKEFEQLLTEHRAICKEIERQSSQGELDIPKEEDELKVKEDSESQEKESKENEANDSPKAQEAGTST
ncbi:uncharacterized protein LOC106167179 [Lingula anatina]|uniref:Uncharacterized protein LOC106167179 n=1 Tax=Lingula anatina TaxID=7574 RepID=A0A1S3IT16_LINAN|nr:uncharacterized protein LOC106167179 [Lingula anatina]|eukprot:XP_013401355.1 uncharacterized protein LOC106167179 [Lingula anatina]